MIGSEEIGGQSCTSSANVTFQGKWSKVRVETLANRSWHCPE